MKQSYIWASRVISKKICYLVDNTLLIAQQMLLETRQLASVAIEWLNWLTHESHLNIHQALLWPTSIIDVDKEELQNLLSAFSIRESILFSHSYTQNLPIKYSLFQQKLINLYSYTSFYSFINNFWFHSASHVELLAIFYVCTQKEQCKNII